MSEPIYYLVVNGRRKGPFPIDELQVEGLDRDSLVWCRGLDDWRRADLVPALQELVAILPPPLPADLAAETGVSNKTEERSQEGSYSPSTITAVARWCTCLLAAALTLPLFSGLFFILAAMYWSPSVRRGLVTYSDMEGLELLCQLSLGLGAVSLVAAFVLFGLLLYMMWSAIQDGHARTTPDKAVGFLFIPFYNIYWVFIAVNGLAYDLNKYIRRHRAGMDAEPAPIHLSLLFCVLFACTVVPYVGFITFFPMILIWLFLVPRLKNCVVTILQVRQAVEGSSLPMVADAEETGLPLGAGDIGANTSFQVAARG